MVQVARLQEQLQKERELRMVLEAELTNSQRPLVISSSIDEATKTELEEIAQAETDVSDLKQRADDLGTQLNKQLEQNSKFHTDTGSQPQQTHQGKP
nr:rho GTPase-activating protein REN1-like [Ipomoea batatas]GME21162.1 rho GTPase-activating protein REN1-like [Ipomoea batatas]